MAEQQRIVKLKSSTGEIFEVDEVVASQSQCLKNVIEDVGVDSPIPLPNVSSGTLRQVLYYCKCYVKNLNPTNNEDLLEALKEDDDFNEWLVNAKLVTELVDMDNLYELIMAANYMHIDGLLQMIYHTIARMIAKRTFGKIRQIFTFTNDFAIGEHCLIGKESQILASFMESLPTDLQLKIKIKVGQRFHHGEWSAWRYDVDAKTLFVELANLYDAYNMHQQIAIILLHIDIGLVNTLVLQTCRIMSLSSHRSGGARIEWVDQMDIDLFKDLKGYIRYIWTKCSLSFIVDSKINHYNCSILRVFNNLRL